VGRDAIYLIIQPGEVTLQPEHGQGYHAHIICAATANASPGSDQLEISEMRALVIQPIGLGL
jgi:hypothetical protein